MTVPLQRSVVYGPGKSRRLGISLGINPLPLDRKVCTMSCIYCLYGKNRPVSPDYALEDVPSVEEVEEALERKLRELEHVDAITFSGNGEPTLHPEFHELVKVVVELRGELAPNAKVALLSNATTVSKPNVRRAIKYVDIPMMKLDAGDEVLFQRINRPHPSISYKAIINGLRSLKDIQIQTAIVGGPINNHKEEDVVQLAKVLRSIKPAAVHIYSIDRPPAESFVKPVGVDTLLRVLRVLSREGVKNVFVHKLTCPRCGSEEIKYYVDSKGRQAFRCLRCGFNTVVVED